VAVSLDGSWFLNTSTQIRKLAYRAVAVGSIHVLSLKGTKAML